MGTFQARTMQHPWIHLISERMRQKMHTHAHIFSFLIAVTVCGLAFGGIVAGQVGVGDRVVLAQAVQHLLDAIGQKQLAASQDLWWQRVMADGQLLALIWLFGVSVIGLPFVVVVIFLRAFSVGFAIGFTVTQFGWKGLLVSGIAIFLHQLISMTILIVAGIFAIRFSAGILRQAYPLQRLSLEFVKYTVLFTLCALGLMLGAAVQAYLAPSLLYNVLVKSS